MTKTNNVIPSKKLGKLTNSRNKHHEKIANEKLEARKARLAKRIQQRRQESKEKREEKLSQNRAEVNTARNNEIFKGQDVQLDGIRGSQSIANQTLDRKDSELENDCLRLKMYNSNAHRLHRF